MILYLDTSVFVKLLIEEPRSADAYSIAREARLRVSSRLLYPEARAALAQAARVGRLDAAGLAERVPQLDRLFIDMEHVEVTAELAVSAGDLAQSRALRGYDAVHLASALFRADEEMVFATADGALAEAARAEGLAVADLSEP